MSAKKSSGKGDAENKKKNDDETPTNEYIAEEFTGDPVPVVVEPESIADRFAKEATNLALELADEKERHMRLMAEYDNFRKRSHKEKENIYSDIRGDTVLKFLPVYDNLERALKQETADDAYAKGVALIMSQLQEIMTNIGVVEITAEIGTKFDPEQHNAVMHSEDENLGESVIAEEFQRGFKLGDKVIRFSMVNVAN